VKYYTLSNYWGKDCVLTLHYYACPSLVACSHFTIFHKLERGHAGGACTIAASRDPNIKAVILELPLLSGRRDVTALPEELLQKAWEERRATDANP
jgi:hypothetical protein